MTLPVLSFHEEYTDAPEWVLLAIGAGVLLLVLLAIVLSIRARRHRAGRAPEPQYAWNDAPPVPDEQPAPAPEPAAFPEPTPEGAFPEPAAAVPEALASPATGEVHYCRCPSCQTQFTVNGPKPIVTNCPGCGKKGYLR